MRRWAVWWGLALVVVVAALLQGLSTMPGYSDTSTWAFWVAVSGSFVMLVAEILLVAWLASALAQDMPLAPPSAALVVWSCIVAVAAVAVVAYAPHAVPLIWTVAIIVLPATALGRWDPLRGFVAFARHPGQAVAATMLLIVSGVAGMGVAFAAGFFLPGFLGGLAAWGWVGIVGAAFLLWWSRLLARPRRRSTVQG